MPQITFHPLGNADSTRIDLDNGKKILIDYANTRCADDASDKRIDLPAALRHDLRLARRNDYNVVAFTHLDDDHISGASEFFYFDYATAYQSDDRVRMQELWVPAAAILEKGLSGDKLVIRQEAKYRLRHGYGIRVFSSPGLLNAWLRENRIDPASRRHLITDAGQVVPGFDLAMDGVEFFAHSPFATRSNQGQLLDRNNDSLTLHATFLAGGRITRAIFLSDLDYDIIRDIVRVTEYHGQRDVSRLDRLKWDVHKVSHHSSYNALGPEKGTTKTTPDPDVDRLFTDYGQVGGIIVSTSDPIPSEDTTQPPHRQAAAYYRDVASGLTGEYVVTMEHPTAVRPAPLVVTIDSGGATIKRSFPGGVGPIVFTPALRAGRPMETVNPTRDATDGLYPAPGEPIGRSDLNISKAQDLAALAADESVPYLDLVECRQAEGGEVVVLDVRPEVPQSQVYDLRHVERVAVVFDAADEHQPNPLALRISFPLVPHINVGPAGVPRSLCLFETSYDDQKVTWTAATFARQLHHRLSATARGEVHDEDQPLEQIFLGSLKRLVLAPAFFDPQAEPPSKDLAIYGTGESLAVLIAVSQADLPPGARALPFAVATYTAEPRTHGIIRLQPRDLAGLINFLDDEGSNLIETLRARLDALSEAGVPLDHPLILVVRFPQRRTDNADAESVNVWAFLTTSTLTEVSVDIGHWEVSSETDGIPGRLLIRDTNKTGTNTPIEILNPTPALTRVGAARYNGTSTDDKRYVAVGVGALGSHVLPPLARSGHGVWTIVDSDHFLPHNVARHALTRWAVGTPKVLGVAHILNQLYEEDVAKAIVADVLRAPTDELVQALTEADIVLDLSASVAVARHLALDAATTARRVSLFLSPSGADLVLLAEPVDRDLRLDLIEMEYYRALIRDGRLRGHLNEPGNPVRYAHTCRDVSARLPGDAVMLHGAISARAVRTLGADSCSRIWRTAQDLSSVVVDVPLESYVEIIIGEWTVSVAQRILDDASRQRIAHLPNETGGVLIGTFDTSRRRLYVVDFIPAPPDSVEWPTAYIRGAVGLVEAVGNIKTTTAHQLGYVGEWHSHPRGASLTPSGDDEMLFAWLSDHRRFDGLPAVMAIFGDGRSSWFVGNLDSSTSL